MKILQKLIPRRSPVQRKFIVASLSSALTMVALLCLLGGEWEKPALVISLLIVIWGPVSLAFYLLDYKKDEYRY